MVSMDRSRHWTEEPIIFLQNDSKQCKIKAAGLDNGVHIVLFYKDSDEPIILSEADEKHASTMSSVHALWYWMDISTIRTRKQWGCRAFHALKMSNGQMLAYVQGIHESDWRLEALFDEVCALYRENDVNFICLKTTYDDANL